MVHKLGAWFRRQSVGRKLTTTASITSGVTLIAACTVFAGYDYLNSRSRLIRDVTMLADIVGSSSAAALTFSDATGAADILRATAVNEHILDARLFTRDGTLLATYMRQGLSWSGTLPENDTVPAGVERMTSFEGNHLRVVRPISFNHEVIEGERAIPDQRADFADVQGPLQEFGALLFGDALERVAAD